MNAENKNFTPTGILVKRKRPTVQRVLFILCFTIMPILNFLVFYVYVNLNSFVMSFQKTQKGELIWTLDHFTRFFTELKEGGSDLRIAFSNTFKTFGINCCMFLIGVFVSYFLYKKIWGYKTFRVLFFLPSILSAIVVANVYINLVSSEAFEGILQKIDGLDYLPEPLAQEEYANKFVFIHMIWMSFPGNMIIWGGTFSRIPDGVIESARLDGVNMLQELFLIELPMVWSTFALMLMLTLSGLFSASGSVFLLTEGKYQTETFSNWVYMQVYTVGSTPSSNSLNYLSAVGLCTTVVACIIALVSRYVSSKCFEDVTY